MKYIQIMDITWTYRLKSQKENIQEKNQDTTKKAFGQPTKESPPFVFLQQESPSLLSFSQLSTPLPLKPKRHTLCFLKGQPPLLFLSQSANLYLNSCLSRTPTLFSFIFVTIYSHDLGCETVVHGNLVSSQHRCMNKSWLAWNSMGELIGLSGIAN